MSKREPTLWPTDDWRCTQCDALLGKQNGVLMECRYRGRRWLMKRVAGAMGMTTCPKCGSMNVIVA